MERKFKGIETGIQGFDAILKGGIPAKSQVLIAGGPGTGKTLMSFEVLYRAAKAGIPAALITLDERPDSVLKDVKGTFTELKDVDELIRKKLLSIDGEDSASKILTHTESESTYSMGNLVSDIEAMVKSIDAQVAAIDSLSFLRLMLGKGILYNKAVSSIVSNLRRLDITTIYTTDIPYYSRKKIKFGQEILLFDGFMALYHLGAEDKEELAIEVIKMRGNNHDRKLSYYEITPSGIRIKDE